MTTCIHMFSEIRESGIWKAIDRDTYNEEQPNRFGWINASMKRTPCPEKWPFFGLLVDGARASWPWSFQAKGMPEDVSAEIRTVCDSFGVEGYGHSHLNLRELVEKYLELMVSGEEAKELLPYLSQLIHELNNKVENHNDIRVVFWFDN